MNHSLWEQIVSVKRSRNGQNLDLYLSCSKQNDFDLITDLFLTGDVQSVLQNTLFNEEMKNKFSLGNTNLVAKVSREELDRMKKILKANQECSVGDVASGTVGKEPSCSTWRKAKRYLQSIGITGQWYETHKAANTLFCMISILFV